MDEQLFPPTPQPPREAGKEQPQAAAAGLANTNAHITSIATRLKLAEERYANLTKRNQITEESLLSFERDIKVELRALTRQSVELRKHLSDMNTKIDAISAELSSVVQKHEFSTVERYLDLWQPVQFISRDEAKRLIEEAKRDAADRDAEGRDAGDRDVGRDAAGRTITTRETSTRDPRTGVRDA